MGLKPYHEPLVPNKLELGLDSLTLIRPCGNSRRASWLFGSDHGTGGAQLRILMRLHVVCHFSQTLGNRVAAVNFSKESLGIGRCGLCN